MYDTYLYNKNTKSLKVSMYVYSMRSIKKYYLFSQKKKYIYIYIYISFHSEVCIILDFKKLIIIKRIISLQLKKEKENKRLEKGRGC